MKNKEQIAKIWNVLDSLNNDVLYNKRAIIKLENEREKPQLKQLDQSVFDHEFVTDHFKYAALNSNGQSIFFSDKPKYDLELGIWYSTAGSTMPMLKGYDASNWQTSLIERETNELTGSELCKAMLERGDVYVMCLISDSSEQVALRNEILGIVTGTNSKDLFTTTSINAWIHVVPINNQGEPLTSSDVGL